MTTQIQTNPVSETSRHNGKIVAGLILIGAGILVALSNLNIFSGAFFLGAMAAIFLVAGLATNRFGLLIPGSILTSLAAGVALVEGPFAHFQEPIRGGLLLLTFAGGFVLITIFSAFFHTRRGILWGFLVPALALGLMGSLLVAGEMQLLWLANYIWPAVLLLVGAMLILRRR